MKDLREGLCAILMLKNENRFILNKFGDKPNPPYTMLEQNIRRLKSLVEEIYIVDNDSNDGSQDIYEKYKDDIIKFIQFNGADLPFDDVRDRKVLLKKAKERDMKWLLVIDGDEIYEDAADKWIHEFCDTHSHHDNYAVKFHYVNFWRNRNWFRTDAWASSWFARLFSMTDLELTGTALHNYSFGFQKGSSYTPGATVMSPVKCLHYGWADWGHRVEKTSRYMKRDMELRGLSFEEAKQTYAADLDENNLRIEMAKPEWAEEFRSGKINY